MTLVITQTCNCCSTFRDISKLLVTQMQPIRMGADFGGWRELTPNVHICPTCITKVLSAPEETPTEPVEPTSGANPTKKLDKTP